MFEEINRNYIDHKGIPSRRLSYTVYNLENDSGFREFAEGRVKQLSVPGNGRKIITDDLPRTGVGLSRMGANKAIALGAYCLCLATIRLIKLGNMLSG